MGDEEVRSQDEEDSDQHVQERNVPVIPYVPDDVQILYADGAYVTLSDGTFIISFVQTEHPLATTAEQRERIHEVRSRCVARVALNPNRMAAVIQVMQETFGQFLGRIEAQKKALGLEGLELPHRIESGKEAE